MVKRKRPRGYSGNMSPYQYMLSEGNIPRDRGVKNWVVGGTAVDNTGTPISGTTSSWSVGGNYLTVNNGAGVNLQLYMINTTIPTSTPGIGRVRVDRVKGDIVVIANGPTIPALTVVVGIYVSKKQNSTSNWQVVSLLDIQDPQRDDLLFLEMRSFATPSNTSAVANTGIHIAVDLPLNVLLGAGLALHCGIYQYGCSGAFVQPALRTLVGPSA